MDMEPAAGSQELLVTIRFMSQAHLWASLADHADSMLNKRLRRVSGPEL